MPYAPKRGGARGRGGGNNTRFTGKRGGSFRSSSSRGKATNVAFGIDKQGPVREDDGTAAAERCEEVKVYDEIDEKMGFWRFESNAAAGEKKIGWLVNMHQVSRPGRGRGRERGKHVARRVCSPQSNATGWLIKSDTGPIIHASRRIGCSRLLLHSG
jgi:hypothetical protein